MLKPVAMKKIRMIGLLPQLEHALKLWRRLGAAQLESVSAEKLGLHATNPLSIYDEISEQLVRVRAIKNALMEVPMLPAPVGENPIGQARQIGIGDMLLQIKEQKAEIEKSREPLVAQRKLAARISGLQVDFSSLPQELDYYLFSAPKKQIPDLKSQWPGHSFHSSWLEAGDNDKKDFILCLVAVPKNSDCSQALAGIEQIKIPKFIGTPKQAMLNIDATLASVEERLRTIDYRLKALSEEYYPLCARLEEALSNDAELARAASKFGSSEECFYVQGWIKEKDVYKFESATKKYFGSDVFIQQVPYAEHHGEGCPTVLQNPAAARPFQFLVEFLSIPKSDEIDPSLITLFTIPIVYGLIVGDAGYAFISLILAMLINSKVKKGGLMWQISRIWMIGAIPSFIFGIAFDEYFGYSHSALLGTKYYEALLHRVENVQGLLLLTIVVGWVSMAFGYLLGAINEWEHSKKHAIAKLSWILIQAGGTMAVATFLLHATGMDIGIAGAIIFGIGAFILIFTEGPMGLVEIPGLASNIMSYARIAAVGVGGVILAEAINQLLAPNPAQLATPSGAIMFALIAICYVLAHIANAFIAMFESFIHGARLSVIELFGKFYHGGGSAFRPFAFMRKYTLATAGQNGFNSNGNGTNGNGSGIYSNAANPSAPAGGEAFASEGGIYANKTNENYLPPTNPNINLPPANSGANETGAGKISANYRGATNPEAGAFGANSIPINQNISEV